MSLRNRSARVFALIAASAAALGVAVAVRSQSVLAQSQPTLSGQPGRAAVASPAPAAVLNQYCTTCHNDRLKTGGFVIDPAGLASVSAGAEAWEKVVRKLR